MRKILPIVCVIIIVVIFFITFTVKETNVNDKFISYERNYNITSLTTDEDIININLFVNNKKTYLVDKNQIVSSYLKDKNNENMLTLEIKDIVYDNKEISYYDDKYYSYTLMFMINFKTENFISWLIDEAILEIEYNDNKKYNINIGSLSINKIDYNSESIIVTDIKPLTSNINDNTFLTGLIIGVRKNTNNVIFLDQINILNSGIFVGNNILEINELPKENNFNAVVNYDYSSVEKGNNNVSITLGEEKIFLLIPLYYDNLIIADTFPIEIIFNNNHNKEKYYFYDYVYYTPIVENISKNNIYTYDIN